MAVRQLWVGAVVLALGCATEGGASRAQRAGVQAAGAPRASAAAAARPHMAVVLLERHTLPAPEAVVAAHRALSPEGPALAIHTARVEGKEGAAGSQFTLGEARLGVYSLPQPMPEGAAEGAALHSASHVAGDWQLKPHQAQLLVSYQEAPGVSAREGLQRFTRLVGAVVRAASAPLGVYWASAHATHAPDFVLKLAGEADASRLAFLWVGLEVSEEAGRVRVASTGMASLGLPEVVLTAPPSRRPQEVLPNTFDLLSYVVGRGEALPAGDTFGWAQEERIPVRYEPAADGAGAQVLRIDLR
jgi:hypothetical protein